MNEMFSGIIVALLSGIALIYSVMVLLFKSVFKPLVIMFSLPLSFTGAFIALLIFGGKKLRTIGSDLGAAVKGFKNGNGHLTFARPDLVDQMNQIIGRHFPGALPPAREAA